jgi:DNA-binding XRE family transcriptional regulator
MLSELVTTEKSEYERLRQAADDLADIIAYARAIADGGESLPSGLVKRMIDGESPLRVYRDYRGLTPAQLSERSGVNRGQVANIEAGGKMGSVETVRKLAEALGLTIDDLV